MILRGKNEKNTPFFFKTKKKGLEDINVFSYEKQLSLQVQPK